MKRALTCAWFASLWASTAGGTCPQPELLADTVHVKEGAGTLEFFLKSAPAIQRVDVVGEAHDQVVRPPTGITAAWVPARQVIQLQLTARRAPGTWLWTLRVAQTGADGAPCTTYTPITAVVDAAVLEVGASQTWRQHWPWDGDTFRVGVAEVGGTGTDLKADWTGATGSDGRAATGAVTCEPGALKANGFHELHCSVAGFGPTDAGEYKGSLRLSGAALAKPVAVEVTLKVHLTRWAIPLLILLGLGLSWGLLGQLEQRVAWLEARRRAADVRARFERTRLLKADRANIEESLKKLGDAIDGAGLDAAVTKVEEAIATATTGYRERWQAVEAEVVAEERAFQPRWVLPDAVAQAVDAVRQRLREARVALDSSPEAAQAHLEAARALYGPAHDAVKAVVETLDEALGKPLPQLGDDLALATERNQLRELDRPLPERLGVLHTAWSKLGRGLPAALDAAAEELAPALEHLMTRLDAAQVLEPHLAKIQRTFDRSVTAQLERHGVLAEAVKDLGEVLAKVGAGASDDFKRGEWQAAVARVLSSGPAQGGHEAAAHLPAASAPRAVTALAPEAGAAPPSLEAPATWAARERPDAQAIRRARRAYELATAVVIVGVGSFLFLDGWVGTIEDCGEVFAWGLGLKVSIDTVKSLVGQVGNTATQR